MALLEVAGIRRRYDDWVLGDVDLELDEGQILCLLGPSGCGKTTLLRMVAGLERTDRGKISFGGQDLTGVPPHRRHFGMMFQEFALFPHKNVFENVAFGLEMQAMGPEQIRERVSEALVLVGLAGLEQRDTAELSGGERQRVALARSLAPRPRLLMLDEPMGSLDRALRERLMVDLRRILKELSLTAIFVTHDQAEAFAVADVVAVMHAGRILQVDPPEDLYLRPRDLKVARFLGFSNIITGFLEENGLTHTPWGPLAIDPEGQAPGSEVDLVIRPDAARLADAGQGTAAVSEEGFIINGRVNDRIFVGRGYLVTLETEAAGRLTFDLPLSPPPPRPGREISLQIRLDAVASLPRAGGVIE